MEAREKARELIERFLNPFDRKGCVPITEVIYNPTAKQCALISVDEVINANPTYENWESSDYWEISCNLDYWQEVKQEIEKL
jgi:hypothetical protein